MDADLQAIQELIGGAALLAEGRQTLLWCLGQLPPLYQQLCQTYESRHGDDILRLVRGMLQAAPELTEGILDRLEAMQGRLGTPGPDLFSLRGGKRPRPRRVAKTGRSA
jgi:hypothetical protein